MLITGNPKRTRLLLRIRRLITAQQRTEHPNWPVEAINTLVTQDMKHVAGMPMRKVRLIVSGLESR